MSTVENRYDFVYLFDCQDGNPNGDPDSDNSPRFDPETFQGLVSDVCLKRKIRDYVLKAAAVGAVDAERNHIYVQSGATLELQQGEAYKALKIEWKDTKSNREDIPAVADWMCNHFFDVRTFGAVMNTNRFNCGQVRGPLQLTFARSVDRILPSEHGISRVTYTKEEKAMGSKGSTELGRKYTIPYGLYVAHGYVNPFLAEKTGFDTADLELVRKVLANLFDLDRSASRGNMAVRGLFLFKHESKLGNAPAQSLFDRVVIKKRDGMENPRAFADYEVSLASEPPLPPGITIIDGLRETIG